MERIIKLKQLGLTLLCGTVFLGAAQKNSVGLLSDDVSVDAGKLGETLISKSIPAMEGMPACLRFSFDEDVLPRQVDFMKRQLFIFPVDQYRKLFQKSERTGFDQRIKFLKDIFKGGHAALAPQIPVFPLATAPQVFRSQVHYLKFKKGMGVGFVTRVGNSETPTTNQNIFYTFQGLTNDGKYLVCFFHPIKATNLPVSEDASFAALYMDQLDPEQFIPKIEHLDAVIRSIEIRSPTKPSPR